MKSLFVYGYIGLLTGLVFAVFHFPGGNIILLLSAVYQLVLSFSYLFIQKYLSLSFKYISLSFFSLYFVNRLLLWPFGTYLLAMAILLFILFLIVAQKEQKLVIKPSFFVIAFIVLVNLSLSFVPNSSVYYYVRIYSTTFKNNSTSYYPWMNYAEILYQDEKYQEALENNLKAQLLLEKQIEKQNIELSFTLAQSEIDLARDRMKSKEAEIRAKL